MTRPFPENPTRYTQLPLPPYSYVPGCSPHPVSDPAGHRFGALEPQVVRFHPRQWGDCEPYLYGIDLFNAGFYWEAHEQWEAVWHAVERRGLIAGFLKGLIKLAAAGVKLRENRMEGVRRHSARAAALFRNALPSADQGLLCGLPIQRLALVADRFAAAPEELVGQARDPVQRRLPVVLTPSDGYGSPSASA